MEARTCDVGISSRRNWRLTPEDSDRMGKCVFSMSFLIACLSKTLAISGRGGKVCFEFAYENDDGLTFGGAQGAEYWGKDEVKEMKKESAKQHLAHAGVNNRKSWGKILSD